MEAPERCPACSGDLIVTELECARCGTQVNGRFAGGRLVNLSEPYASVLELFLKVRGNVKEMERKLGLSYPTIRSRLEDAFQAAGLGAEDGATEEARKARRIQVLEELKQGTITAEQAAEQLKQLKDRR
ncbi:MAG TPA: DUF2089 domain-containing protein [Chloroflexota bacterium]|nr:DUF2089 domain-containing protein [Chloroflexota bacterium]